MSGVWGKNIQFSIFGESHGVAIGGVLSSVNAGKKLDFQKIDIEMKRRNHRAFYSTNRNETDAYEILSGVTDGVTNGFPLAFSIRNGEHNSKDYPNLNNTPRPGHADYPASIKHNGFNDYKGGGHFSGRITAPLFFSGAVAKQYLEDYGIKISAHIKSIGNVVSDKNLPEEYDSELSNKLFADAFPVIDNSIKEKMFSEISLAKEFIDELPEGLDTVVGENGIGLSEGQIQRIAIARAVLTRAPILLLDDIFDKFDFERVSRILTLLEDRGFGQVFITDTHLERVEKIIGEGLKERTKIFKL